MSIEEIMKLYNIDVDYSKDCQIQNIHNSLIINNVSDSTINNNLIYLLKYNSPEKLGLILINTSDICFNFYDGAPNILALVQSDADKINSVLSFCEEIMNSRYNLLLNKKVKDFIELEEKENKKTQSIIIMVDELFNLLKYQTSNDHLLNLLLKGEKVGIKFIFYSKFSKKNLNLGYIDDLVETYNDYNIENLISSETKPISPLENANFNMDGYEFEKYSANLLAKNGFQKVEVTKCSSDFGVDIIAFKDDIKYAIQCKRYSSAVGIKAVQEVIGSKAMNNCHVAVVLTNNYFTKSAKELAQKNNVLLWDKDKLNELIHNYNKIKKENL